MKKLIFAFICLFLVVPGQAGIIYVDDDAPNDPCAGNPDYGDPCEDGGPEHPFDAVQEAIDVATSDDTVIVLDGTYTGLGNRDIDFLGKAITVRSESGPENCIIDCNGTETDPHRGFYFHNGELTSSVVDGFTIKNGYMHPGAGIYCSNSSPIIKNCVVTENVAEWLNGQGGGCYFSDSFSEVMNCQITYNYAVGTSPHSGNGWGGGIAIGLGSNVKIKNSQIMNNYATYTSGGIGVHSSLFMTNSVISNNSSQYSAGLTFQDSNSTLTNCTIANNNGYGLYQIRSNIAVVNTILWSNSGGEIGGSGGLINTSYSDILGGWPGEGNIDADPCFAEPGYWDANDTPDDVNDDFWVDGDYYLLPNSLCIDAGDPDYIAEPNETDLDGNPRVSGDAIDMGAYETNYIQAAMKLTPQVLNCNSKGKYVKAHFVLPEEFLPEDVDVNKPAWAEPMGAESEYIKVLGAGTSPVRLEICFDREAFYDSVTETGKVEITVIGSLTTGQYFYATDTIKIKPRR